MLAAPRFAARQACITGLTSRVARRRAHMNHLSPTTELLNAELPDERFTDDQYLAWLYEQNPYGPAIQRNVDDDGVRVAHYALVPQRYRDENERAPAMFSLNAVTRSGLQRTGHFRRIGLEIYEEAAAAGFRFVVGVSNEKSVGAVVKYMGWRHWGPMPVRLCAAVGRAARGVTHHPVTPELLASDAFETLVGGLDGAATEGWVNCWTPEYLRWRLGCPHAAYVVHSSDDLVAITTRDRRFGVNAAVILKLLPRPEAAVPLSPAGIIAAACRYHRAPYAVYAGFNRRVPVRGVRPPRRLQPSPLHLIIRHLDPALDQEALVLDTFEFLDADAY